MARRSSRWRGAALVVVLTAATWSCATEATEDPAAPAPATNIPPFAPSPAPPTDTQPAPTPTQPQGATESEILQLLWDDSTPEEQRDWCELISLMGAAQFATFVVAYFPGELSPETVSEWSTIHCTGQSGLEGKDLFLDNVWNALSAQDRRDACLALTSQGPLVAGSLVIQGLGQGLTYEYRAPDGSFSLTFTAEDFATLLLERC